MFPHTWLTFAATGARSCGRNAVAGARGRRLSWRLWDCRSCAPSSSPGWPLLRRATELIAVLPQHA